MMVALPAVANWVKSIFPFVLMAALPAVLVLGKIRRVVVVHGGAAGCAGVEECQPAGVGDVGAAGRGVSKNCMNQLLLYMVALPAVLLPRNSSSLSLMLVLLMVALPAELALRNCVRPVVVSDGGAAGLLRC